MYRDSVLTSVIQVAIAIAGFSGIVAVLGHRSEGVWDEMDRIRLQGLLVGSFATMIIAFLPYILFSAELAESLVWRICSGIHAVGIGMDVVAKIRQHIAADIRFTGSETALLFIAAAITVVQGANTLFLATVWPFLTGLVANLLVSFALFVLLLTDLRDSR